MHFCLKNKSPSLLSQRELKVSQEYSKSIRETRPKWSGSHPSITTRYSAAGNKSCRGNAQEDLTTRRLGRHSASQRWCFKKTRHFIWLDFQSPSLNAASVTLPLRLMDGILHPSIVSRGSITAAIDCVWTLMDEGARLLNGAAPYEIIRLSVHISAVTRLSRGGGWGVRFTRVLLRICFLPAESVRWGPPHWIRCVYLLITSIFKEMCKHRGPSHFCSHYNNSHLIYHAFALIKGGDKTV